MSKTRALQLGAAALATAGVLSACSSGTNAGSIPPPASATGTPASSSQGGGEAPSVPSPLPTAALLANPCNGGLSADQVYKLGLAATGTKRQDQTGATCTWRSDTYDANQVSITAVTPNKNGLSDVYATRGNDKYFEPTTVSGYPAVYAGILDRSGGDCSLWVGVTDQLAVNVQTQILDGPNKSNPCPVVERVATAMVQHLQGS
ncbi:DUF3558 domain-containing protein [Amycolatopsis pithecellobii]|uniref:DUF3558 domain-containing protein n=1 Tax=Amycolatopsis pithecellobii TaxID=664692 RepID=A0A6N7ZAD3_9PSEU|nr:DUF3558 domain-containing protein [Amycolatopsis pithecellobii]MTD58701.1 DUF3558 domain-containing protein [Amycolatopsis pithecellobii]